MITTRHNEPKESTVNLDEHEETEYLTIDEAATLLRVPTATLRWWRSQAIGPPSRKFGRHVRYPKRALLRWADSQGRAAATTRPESAHA